MRILSIHCFVRRKTGANHYHAQLGLLDKCCAIKEFVLCSVLPNTLGIWTEM